MKQYTDWEDEVLDSIVWWEHMHQNWSQDPQWQITAPHYGEMCAQIVAAKYRFIEARKLCEKNPNLLAPTEEKGDLPTSAMK